MAIFRSFLIFNLLMGTLVLYPVQPISAQSNPNDFAVAVQLMRDGEFEEAYRLLEPLMRENPRSFAIYDRAVTALVNLRRYDDAISISLSRLEHHPNDINSIIKLGEIYHIADDTDRAVATWHQAIEHNPENPHSYRQVAEKMNERRLYREAIAIFEKARVAFSDRNLFSFNIADNYLAVGDFEPAIAEYLDLILHNEDYLSRIQRQFLNYDEQRLYDTAILMVEEKLSSVAPASRQDLIYRDFLVWLNMERGLFRRAFVAARTLALNTDFEHHTLFRTARQLRSNQQFELAEEAFRHYTNRDQHALKPRSFEELSRTYMDWAGYLIDQNMDFSGAADSLYRNAFQAIDQLTQNHPGYDRIMQTLSLQAELALDYLKDPDRAEYYLERMRLSVQSDEDLALSYYIEGRLYLYESDFSMARVSFTRSNRMAERNETAEKSRYYLGLSDFFNGDFTYARLQLRSLERFHHSLFANNALQLRYLIQQGYTDGEENKELHRLAHARFLYETGQTDDAVLKLLPVLDESLNTPLYEASVLLLARALRGHHPESAYHILNQLVVRPSFRLQSGEKLLWERARLAEMLYLAQLSNDASVKIIPETLRVAFSSSPLLSTMPPHRPPLSLDDVISSYEELLVRFPEGYYSGITRDRIRELEKNALET